MSSVNPITREVLLKVVFYGPGLGGKTTSLQHIHAASKPEHRGKMVSLATPVDRTLYFDFLPVRLPKVAGYTIRLQLFTVPGQVYYNATRKLVLTGADGVVFVADSQRERLEANVESLENLKANLTEHGASLEAIPLVFEFNKRDLPSAAPIDEMETLLNERHMPAFPTVATLGTGIFETLEAVTRSILSDLRQKRVLWTDGEAPSLSEGFLAQEDGIVQTLQRLAAPEEAPAPPATRIPATPAPPRTAAPPTPAPSVAKRSAVSPSAAPVFGALFTAEEADLLREVEAALAAGDGSRAVELLEPATTRELALAASSLGEGAPRDPIVAALLLGADGRRYARFRSICRKRQEGTGTDVREGVFCYLFLLDLRLRRSGL